jgi:hypothetical protein
MIGGHLNVAADKMVLFLQEQGHSVVLSDADSIFHAIKVTTVHYAMQFFLCILCNLHLVLPFELVADLYLYLRHLAKVMVDGVMTPTVLNLAHSLPVTFFDILHYYTTIYSLRFNL